MAASPFAEPTVTGQPIVVARFLGTEILGELGRLLFSLLNAFVMSGYRIRLSGLPPLQALNEYARLACSLKNVTLTESVPADCSDMIYLYDKEDRALARRRWRKKIEIRYDVFSPYWLSDPILMPFPVHPVHAGLDLPERLRRHRAAERKLRLFFSGETKGYFKNRIHYPRSKLPRLQVLETIKERMAREIVVVREKPALDRLLAEPAYTAKCVLVDTTQFRVSDPEWLGTLAKADFFLCPPGLVMPMCHNGVEAMAVGTIPVINYPEWFDPALVHLENCIVFDDEADLVTKLQEVLAMDARRIAELRQRAINYYEEHLSARSFTARIESHPARKLVVLIITEPNTARNASKLNRYSILIRGTSQPRAGRWWSTLATGLGFR
jgi:hypothetical protein